MGSIHASMLGAGIIYKEERDKTVEFLMAKPISRKTIITSKIMAALTNVVIFNIVTYATSFIILKGLTDANITSEILLSMLSTFLIQLIFMVLGITASSIMKNPKKAGALTMAILLGTFFLSWIVALSDKLEILTVLTPFKYFEAASFFKTNSLNVGYIILILVIICGLLKATYYKYERRDLNL
jgi:ABC-2 type transport system permease protein